MPLYNYQCKKCGEVFEVRATIKEKIEGLKVSCPKCKSRQAKQLLTAAAVVHGGKEIVPSVCGPNAGAGCCG